MAARLGILAGFTAMFALCLKLLTGSRRIEIFAATSTYVRFQLLAYPRIETEDADGESHELTSRSADLRLCWLCS
jgi:hypothetical protein